MGLGRHGLQSVFVAASQVYHAYHLVSFVEPASDSCKRIAGQRRLLRIEDVLAMAPALVAVVDDELKDDVLSSDLAKRNILRDGSVPRTVLFDSLCHGRPVCARVAGPADRPDVKAMVSSGHCKAFRDLKRGQTVGVFEESDSLVHSVLTLLDKRIPRS